MARFAAFLVEFARSKSGRSSAAYLLLLAVMSAIVGYAMHASNLRWFVDSKGEEKRTAVELADAFVAAYGDARSRFSVDGAPVPATFRAHAIDRFNKVRESDDALRLVMAGVPGRVIVTPPSDEDMANSIRRFVQTAAREPETRFLELNGQTVLRTLYPSVASLQSCVDCHNQIQPDQPRLRLNDILGAFAVDIPVDAFLRQSRLESLGFAVAIFLVGGVAGISIFVTQFHQLAAINAAEASARVARTHLAGAVDGLSDGFALFDAQDRLVLCNPNYRRMHLGLADILQPGITFEAIVRESLTRNRYDYSAEGLEAHVQKRMEQHRRSACAFERRLANGRWEHVREDRLPDGGVSVLISDITERKQVEVELVEAKIAAESANRAKSEFLANMSHELRTPLNAIIGFGDIIAEEAMGADARTQYRDYAGDIGRSGRHLLDLINDILDMSKIEADKLDLRDDEIEIADMVASCMRMVSQRASEAGIEVTTQIPSDLPPVRADEVRLKQIVLNLLSNAVKFTPAPGSVTILAARQNDGGVSITVTDTGIGMTKEQLKVALEPFGQIDSSLARKHEGTGLGLPLVDALARKHGGALIVDSAPGRGTRATITLPPDRVLARAGAPALAEAVRA
jgi:signal transduction histidine kinase